LVGAILTLPRGDLSLQLKTRHWPVSENPSRKFGPKAESSMKNLSLYAFGLYGGVEK
jgi:hypothetical protein